MTRAFILDRIGTSPLSGRSRGPSSALAIPPPHQPPSSNTRSLPPSRSMLSSMPPTGTEGVQAASAEERAQGLLIHAVATGVGPVLGERNVQPFDTVRRWR